MTKTFLTLALPLALLAGGCAETSEPAIAADPAKVEMYLASLESVPAPEANSIEEKIVEADKVAGTLAKVQPEKIDPNLVATIIAR
jgi:outer membrane lipoprotein-sorting protein